MSVAAKLKITVLTIIMLSGICVREMGGEILPRTHVWPYTHVHVSTALKQRIKHIPVNIRTNGWGDIV